VYLKPERRGGAVGSPILDGFTLLEPASHQDEAR
jgi:hypothetical protein